MVKVIVIDDNEDTVDSIAQTLEIEGIEVLEKGYDGEQAIQLYEKFKPDVLIIDLKMPKFDGNYAMEKIKSKYPKAKIILVTASSFSASKKSADVVFTKPYNVEEFINTVKSF